MATNYRRLLSATSLVGDGARNMAGEDIGTIEELMINVETGQTEYAVLSFGGIMGIGDKLFAIPWSKLRVSEEERKFIVNVPKETLEMAPGFDKDNWPDMADPAWQRTISTHYAA